MQISCALTTFNSNPLFLEKQLDSLRNQERPFDEVIIVDDASSDDTLKRLKEYVAQYHLRHWRIIAQKKNTGFVRAFIHALQETSKDIVFLCDHDDIWHLNKTKKMAEILEKDPNLECLACGFEMIDQADQPIACSYHPANLQLIHRKITEPLTYMNLHDIWIHNFAPGCTLAVKQDLVKDYLKYSDELDLPHDWALCALATLRKPETIQDQKQLAYFNEALIDYRQHENNTLGLSRRQGYEERLKAAYQEAQQKKSLWFLTQILFASPNEQVKMRQIYGAFKKRYEALYSQSLSWLFSLIFVTHLSGFWKTLGMDMKATLVEKFRFKKSLSTQRQLLPSGPLYFDEKENYFHE